MSDLFIALLVLFVGIPTGALVLLVVAFYLSEAVRKVWGRR